MERGRDSASPSNGQQNGDANGASPRPLTDADRSVAAALLERLVAGHAPMLSSTMEGFRFIRQRMFDGTVTDVELRDVLKKWQGYPKFEDTVKEARRAPRREARDARRQARENGAT